jgi:hypothetical protein
LRQLPDRSRSIAASASSPRAPAITASAASSSAYSSVDEPLEPPDSIGIQPVAAYSAT